MVRIFLLFGIETPADLHHVAALTKMFATALFMVDAELSTPFNGTLVSVVHADGYL